MSVLSKVARTAIGSTRIRFSTAAERISSGERNRLLTLTASICALSFLSVRLLPGLYGVFSVNNYLVFHTVFEFLSIIVSFVVFLVGWYGYKQNANKQDLVIGVVFLVVGLIDFAHALSYNGMPQFLSPNSVSKAATYWIAARLADAVGLFAAAFVLANSKRRWLSPWFLAPAGLMLVTATVVAVSYFLSSLPPMFIPGRGLTPLKIALEWTVITLYAAAVFAFGARGHREANVVLLQLALVVAIFSELSFTVYRSAYDTYNTLGHLYKVIAYFLIFKALFVSSFQRPYYELMQARNQIEQSFSRIGTALASSLELNKTLHLIAELASDMLRSKHAAVMLLRDGELHIQAQRGMPENPTKVSTEHITAGTAVATKQPVAVEDVAGICDRDVPCHCQRLDGPPARSVVSAPIMSGDDVLGVVEVYSPEIGAFGPKEADLLSTFARQAAVAIKNSIAYEQERTVSETFQRSLLPTPPAIPGLDIAVRYVPAEDAARVGGDLYDVFPVDDERLAIVIGDVCGHGLDAASLMAMAEYMIKGFLIHGMPPGAALGHTNLALCRSVSEDEYSRFVTVFVCVLNTSTCELLYANAGHHMPVILRKGACDLIELHSDLPLGVDESLKYRTHKIDLQDADGLLLYTDGIIETRRHGELFGDDRLCAMCGEMADRSAQKMLDHIIEKSRGWSGIFQDDVVLLALKWVSSTTASVASQESECPLTSTCYPP